LAQSAGPAMRILDIHEDDQASDLKGVILIIVRTVDSKALKCVYIRPFPGLFAQTVTSGKIDLSRESVTISDEHCIVFRRKSGVSALCRKPVCNFK
jgi:hypothetical protein